MLECYRYAYAKASFQADRPETPRGPGTDAVLTAILGPADRGVFIDRTLVLSLARSVRLPQTRNRVNAPHTPTSGQSLLVRASRRRRRKGKGGEEGGERGNNRFCVSRAELHVEVRFVVNSPLNSPLNSPSLVNSPLLIYSPL
jgi:hypothetical protein